MKKNTPNDSILKNIARYSFSNLYSRIFGLAYSFLKPKLLSPELYGLLNLISLFPRYSTYAELGVITQMRYQIPQSTEDLQKKIKKTVFLGSLAVNSLISIGIVLAVLLFDMQTELHYGLIMAAIVVMLQWYTNYIIAILKAESNFRLISSSNFIDSNITLFLGVALLLTLGFYGVLITTVCSYTGALFYLHFKIRSKNIINSNSSFCWGHYWKMVKSGFPIMAYDFLALLIKTQDRFLISYFLGLKFVGFYSLSTVVFGFMTQIPGATREVVESMLMSQPKNADKEHLLHEYLYKPLINTAYYSTFLIGSAFLMVPIVLPFALPNYTEGILPCQLTVLGVFFFSLSYMARGLIVANNWQKLALKFMILTLFLSAGIDVVLLQHGYGIKGVALGSSLSFYFLFILLFSILKRKLQPNKKEWRKIFLTIHLVFSFMVILLSIVYWLPLYYYQFSIQVQLLAFALYLLTMILVLQLSSYKMPLLKKFF